MAKQVHRSEAGSGTALVAAVILIGVMLASIAVVVGTYVMAASRARDMADLVALSAAAAGVEACEFASDSAVENEVELIGCTAVGDAFDFVVSVQVAVPIGIPGLPSKVSATAYAGWLGR